MESRAQELVSELGIDLEFAPMARRLASETGKSLREAARALRLALNKARHEGREADNGYGGFRPGAGHPTNLERGLPVQQGIRLYVPVKDDIEAETIKGLTPQERRERLLCKV